MSLEKIKEFLVNFNNSYDIVCEIFNIKEKEETKKLLKKKFPEIEWEKIFNKNLIEINKDVSNDICGLFDEYEKIKKFLTSKEMKFMLIVGQPNSGKTLILNRALNVLNIFYELIMVPKDFIGEANLQEDDPLNTVYILDNIDQERLHPTKIRKLKQIISERHSKNKIIIIAHEYEKNDFPYFDMIIEIKKIPLLTIINFVNKNFAELNLSEEKIKSMYVEVNFDMYYLIEYLKNGINLKENIVVDPIKTACQLTKMIYTQDDRNSLFYFLEKTLEHGYIRNSEKDKKISYETDLEPFLVSNIPVFYKPEDDAFYHNIFILNFIKNNVHNISNFKMLKLLSYGIKISYKEASVILPERVSQYQKTNVKWRKKNAKTRV